MVMLDSLLGSAGRDAYLSRTLAQGWLIQAVDRGDLIRILEPLLIMLLHPDSARSQPLQHDYYLLLHTLRVNLVVAYTAVVLVFRLYLLLKWKHE